MAAPIVEGYMMWRCKCGKTSFRHHEHCDSCGEPQPAPPPEAEPSDVSRPDSGGPVTGGMDMGLDLSTRSFDATLNSEWWSNPDGDGLWFTREVLRDKSNSLNRKVGNYYGQFSNDVSMTDDREAQMQRADEPQE